MIDDASNPPTPQFESFEPIPKTPSVLPNVAPVQPPASKKSSKKRWTIFGITVGILACCLLMTAFAVVFTLLNFGQEKASIAKVLDGYMYAMKVKNPERAYGFFSPHATSQVPISRLQEWLDGKGYGMFEGYQSITVDSFSLVFVIKKEPNQPQGIVYSIKGTIFYEGGVQGSMNATLEKVNGEWKIFDVTVKVPREKLK